MFEMKKRVVFFDDTYDVFENVDDCFYFKMNNIIDDLLPKVPKDIVDKLQLHCCTLGGLGRDKLDQPYLEEHRIAFNTCRQRQETIELMMCRLNELREYNQQMIGCLRNSYQPPYDPDSFLDAFFFSQRSNPRFVDQKWIKVPENYKKLEDAFNWWMEKFRFVVGSTAMYKYIGQHEDRTKGYFAFYIPGLIGEFHFTIPENIQKDFGHSSTGDDMKIGISYSIPGKGVIDWRCFSWGTICEAYTFEKLQEEFSKVLKENSTTHLLKTEQDFCEEFERGFNNDVERYKKDKNCFHDPSASDYVESMLMEMEDNKLKSVTETSTFKRELKYMLEQINIATTGKK